MPKSESPPPRRRRSPSKSPSRSPPPKKRDDDENSINPGNNLYVSGLSVLDARLVLDPRTKESRGFGFVTMATLEDADRAVKYLNKSVLEGRVLACEKFKLYIALCYCNNINIISNNFINYFINIIINSHSHSNSNMQKENVREHPHQALTWACVVSVIQARRIKPRPQTPGKYLGSRSGVGPEPSRGGRDDRDHRDRDRDRDYRDRDRDHPRDSHRRRTSPRYSPYGRRRSRSRSPRYSPYRR
eukprot:jgi/Chlat1/5736/Chrsp38S05579